MKNKPTITVVSHVGMTEYAPTGGVLRATRSVAEYVKHFNVNIILPPSYRHSPINLQELKNKLNVNEIIILDTRLRPILNNERITFIYPLIPSGLLGLLIKGLKSEGVKSSAVIVLIEVPDCLKIGCIIKNEFNIPTSALIQLPIFYYDKKRLENIKKAFYIWFEELYKGELSGKFIRKLKSYLEITTAHSIFTQKILQDYNLLIAVSKAIPLEMGPKWRDKFYVLDPGVALDEEDFYLISKVKEKVKKEGDYIVFGGRVDALKGFIEALYVFRELRRSRSSLKLIVTGHIGDKLMLRIERLLKRLELREKVILTGLIPRLERFKIVGNAKVFLYPSHADAFPYGVLESLHLGTPIVAYSIPALRIYYGNCEGVRLVEEGNIEALVAETLNALESRDVDVKPPQLKSWNEILAEEVELINRLIEMYGFR